MSVNKSKTLLRSLQGPPKQVAQILFDMAKVARSFAFYDKNNRAIRMFLDDLFTDISAFLEEHGALELVIGADRFTWSGQSVYHDADREHGLPFKLYRDGMRALRLRPGLDQDEMDRFLNVLAKRPSTGRSAEEDDISTLLWKQDLAHLDMHVVEGFTQDLRGAARASGAGVNWDTAGSDQGADDEQRRPAPAGDDPMSRLAALQSQLGSIRGGTAALDFDTPDLGELDGGNFRGGARLEWETPSTPRAADVPWPALDGTTLQRLHSELDEDDRFGLLHLLDHLYQALEDDPTCLEDDALSSLLAGVRRYALAERTLQPFAALVRWLFQKASSSQLPPHLHELSAALLRDFAAPESLAAMVAVTDEGEARALGMSLQLLGPLVDNALLLDLVAGASDRTAAALAQAIVARLRGDLGLLDAALADGDPGKGRAALRCLALLQGPPVVALVQRAAGHAEPEVRAQALRALGVVAPGLARQAALDALQDESREVVDCALDGLSGVADRAVASKLQKWLEGPGWSRLDVEGRERCVRVIVRADPAALGWLESHLKLGGLRSRFGGLMKGDDSAAWNDLVVTGLTASPSPRALALLQRIHKDAKGTLSDRAGEALAAARARR